MSSGMCLACSPMVQTLHIIQVIYSIAVSKCTHTDTAHVLGKLCELYGINCMEQDMAWFLEHGYISGRKSKAIRLVKVQLCTEVAAISRDIVTAFGIPDVCIHAPIALSQ